MILASSNLQPLDVAIIAALLAIVAGFAVYARRFTRSVADFLSANRCAKRYLLTVASGASGMGAISIVAMWEQFYQAGFTAQFWGQMLAPIGLLMALTGWIIYRYRETRALTLAQLMEMRYSRRFRVFSGTLCWLSGVLNYGIFPAVTARFFIYFLGLPVHVWKVPGTGLTLNLTLGLVMAVLLGSALLITITGGQVSVMVTDFIQGQISNLVFLALLGVMLWIFPWQEIISTLKQAPAGQSMLNPFDAGSLPDFNPVYFFILMFLSVYNYMVWQGSQGYNASALNPHEAKMAGILAQFRAGVTGMLIPLAAVCAYVLMNAPAHEAAARAAESALAGIGDDQLARQMTTTVALSQVLPTGVMGLLAAAMFMASLATDSTYLHSWGSIFVQDVLSPIRQLRGMEAQIEPARHLKWLRWSIFGVAAFGWLFSMLFPLKEFINMYFGITGAIYTGGAGAVLIGALYWKRGTTAAAWASMLIGSCLAVGGLLLTNIIWPSLVPALQQAFPEAAWVRALPSAFWLNGLQMGFVASLTAAASYVVVSLCTPDPQIDMDRLLHRGAYRVQTPNGTDHPVAPPVGWKAILPSPEFTGGDRLIYWLKVGWVLFFFVTFLGICLWQVFQPWPDEWWANWWLFNLVFTGVTGTLATVWFLVGGLRDLKALFILLDNTRRDAADDGSVPPDEHLGKISR